MNNDQSSKMHATIGVLRWLRCNNSFPNKKFLQIVVQKVIAVLHESFCRKNWQKFEKRQRKRQGCFHIFFVYLILSFVCFRKSLNCRPLFHNDGCLFPKSMFLYLLVESFKAICD